jgi:hypothetical protein
MKSRLGRSMCDHKHDQLVLYIHVFHSQRLHKMHHMIACYLSPLLNEKGEQLLGIHRSKKGSQLSHTHPT